MKGCASPCSKRVDVRLGGEEQLRKHLVVLIGWGYKLWYPGIDCSQSMDKDLICDVKLCCWDECFTELLLRKKRYDRFESHPSDKRLNNSEDWFLAICPCTDWMKVARRVYKLTVIFYNNSCCNFNVAFIRRKGKSAVSINSPPNLW